MTQNMGVCWVGAKKFMLKLFMTFMYVLFEIPSVLAFLFGVPF